MSYEALTFDITDQVALITLNRPKAYNALNLQMAKDLYDVSLLCGDNPDIRAVVLTGSGDKAYCAGGDIPGFVANQDKLPALLKDMTTYLHMAISRFTWMDPPIIAAVNGVAAGAGLSLMAFCDLAIASTSAKFTSAYTKIGMTPDGSSTYFLPRMIGTRRTAELYLTNRVLSAEEALDWGLVNQVVPGDKVLETAMTLARELAQGPTISYGGVKRLLASSTNDSLESQMERETRSIVRMSKTKDTIEGLNAFVEKRSPNFKGE